MTRHDARQPLATATAIYRAVLDTILAGLPAAAALYLYLFQDPRLSFHAPTFHEIAIAVSIVLSVFAAWVGWRCYQDSGDPALRFVTLAFLGFAIVYAPHGALTREASDNLWLFLLFGPASRVVMTAFMLAALTLLERPADPPELRRAPRRWLPWLALCVAVDGAVAVLALSPIAGQFWVRAVMEGTAIVFCLLGVAVVRHRGRAGGMMWMTQVALLGFAQSSAIFLLALAWNHLWWLAHAVFAGGFFVLSYGIAKAYQTTRSFARIYNEEEIIARLAASEAAARAFQESEERLRVLFDSSPVGVVVADHDGRILYCNRGQAELLGMDLDQVRRLSERDFYPQPETRDAALDAMNITGKPVSAETAIRRADGEEAWAAVTWLPTRYDGQPCRVTWTRDITDIRRAAEALGRAKEAAELANRAKTEFLAAVSHELRTPLNAIIGFAETMEAEALGPLGNPRYREYCQHIQESGRHLSDLINDVLDVARVETGRLTLREETIQVARLVGAAAIMVADRARAAGLALHQEVPSDLPLLVADERRIKQVLINLLSNAIKFTPAGGSITIAARLTPDGGLALTVTDTGIGIAPEHHAKALAWFGQVDSGLERRFEGLGLGLPLSRNLMELHGGSLDLDSQPGRGTTVTARFPACRLERTAAVSPSGT